VILLYTKEVSVRYGSVYENSLPHVHKLFLSILYENIVVKLVRTLKSKYWHEGIFF